MASAFAGTIRQMPSTTAVRNAIALAIALWVTLGSPARGAEKVELTPREFKAAILSKLAPYIEWPGRTDGDAGAPIVIGILGDVDFRDLLEELLKDRQIRGRSVVVRRVAGQGEIGGCNLLFVPEARYGEWDKIRTGLNTKGVLTVGDSEHFPVDAGIICNLEPKHRMLEINLRLAKEAGLNINPQLLHVARVVP